MRAAARSSRRCWRTPATSSKTRRGYELTPQGVRKIGEKALHRHLPAPEARTGSASTSCDRDRRRRRAHRRHQAVRVRRPVPARSAEDGDERGPARRAPARRCGCSTRATSRSTAPSTSTRSSTVLMVDMSRSMLYNGCFTAAKRVALALDSLIRGKYPRDHLNIIGFSYLAQELKPADLPTLDLERVQLRHQHAARLPAGAPDPGPAEGRATGRSSSSPTASRPRTSRTARSASATRRRRAPSRRRCARWSAARATASRSTPSCWSARRTWCSSSTT